MIEIITCKIKVISASSKKTTYFGDDFGTTHHVEFLNDEKFIKAYESAVGGISEPKLKNVDIRWRAHIVSWAANQTLNIPGDFVECGVWSLVWDII